MRNPRFRTSLMFLMALILSLPMVASAHTRMKESTPADGAAVNAAPETIELVFNGPVRLIRLDVEANGQEVPVEFKPAREAVATYSFAMPAIAAGTVSVDWAAIGADGHTVSDTFSFTIDPAGASD